MLLTVLTVPKMAARLELAFSGTTPVFHDVEWHVHRDLRVAAPTTDGQQQRMDGSWAAVNEAARMAHLRSTDARGIKLVEVANLLSTESTGADMADGTGLISVDLAKEVADAMDWDSIPCLTQVRVWYDGSVAKGTLMTSGLLPPRTIVVRDSQIKVDAGPRGAEPRPLAHRDSLEVVRRQHPEHNLASLGIFLAPLLENAGGEAMAESLLSLQRQAAEESCQLLRLVSSGQRLTEDQVIALLRQLEMLPEREESIPWSTSAFDLLLAGFDTTDEFVRQKVTEKLMTAFQRLAQGKVPRPMPRNRCSHHSAEL